MTSITAAQAYVPSHAVSSNPPDMAVTNGVSPSASSCCSSQNLEVRAIVNELINLLLQIVTSYAPFLYIAV
jgi:hypothetical protein